MKAHTWILIGLSALALVPAAQTAGFKFQDQTLTVPEGFVVELVAGPPQVNRPIVASFDEAGRLYVADSSGSNDKTDKQLQDRPHRIVQFEAANNEGRF